MTDQTDTIRGRRDDLRAFLAAADPVTTQTQFSAEQTSVTVRAITSSLPPSAPQPAGLRRSRRRLLLVSAGVTGALALGGVGAVAGLRPAGEVASAPLAAPIILSGVGPVTVPLPVAPRGATYLRLELTCFDGTLCATPGGSVTSDKPGGSPMVQRDAVPLTAASDASNAQMLSPLDVTRGLPVTVGKGTHWRLYAVFTDALNSKTAQLDDGRTLGVPNNDIPPDLVPAVATNGRAGWVSYRALTYQAHPQLTGDGLSQEPIPVYDQDGITVVGAANVSLTVP